MKNLYTVHAVTSILLPLVLISLAFLPHETTAQWTLDGSYIYTYQNVGINTVRPEASLHVKDHGTTRPAVYIEGAGAQEGDMTYRTGDAFQIGEWDINTDQFTERMSIRASGRVKINEALFFSGQTGDRISLYKNRIGQANMKVV